MKVEWNTDDCVSQTSLQQFLKQSEGLHTSSAAGLSRSIFLDWLAVICDDPVSGGVLALCVDCEESRQGCRCAGREVDGKWQHDATRVRRWRIHKDGLVNAAATFAEAGSAIPYGHHLYTRKYVVHIIEQMS